MPWSNKMGKLLIWLSLLTCLALALFLSDLFAHYHEQLIQSVPATVVTAVNKAKLKLFSLWSDKLFTKEELSKYTGESGELVYIAVLGEVFDVTKGRKHYGPGGGYSFFAGRDGSRAFVSGDFTEKGLVDDVSGFKTSEAVSLQEWKDFYHKEYTYLGKLIGSFYSSDGQPTTAMVEFQKLLDQASVLKKEAEKLRQIFPPCNSQFTQTHTKFWCSDRSGGVERYWVGVPRQYFQPDAEPRCVCVRTTGPPSADLDSKEHKNRGDLDHPNLKPYENCDPNAVDCSFIRTE